MEKLKSRKLIFAVLTTLIVIINNRFDLCLSEETIEAIVGLTMIYVLGQGLVDFAKEKKNEKI